MTGKERVTESGKGTSVLTLILSYPQNRDAKDWAAGNGRLSYCYCSVCVCVSNIHCFQSQQSTRYFPKQNRKTKSLPTKLKELLVLSTTVQHHQRCGVHSYVSNESQGDDVLAIQIYLSLSLSLLNRKQFINENNLKSMLCTILRILR